MPSHHPDLPIYCINLDHRQDRWAHIKEVFKNTPIEHSIQRFPGIYASSGITGCRESHFALIRKAKEENYPWIGIMEDDCTPHMEFSQAFPKALELLWKHRNEWDIFNSGPIDVKSMARIEGGLIQIDDGVCTQFIIINQKAYDKILDSYILGVSEGGIDLYYRDLTIKNKSMFTYAPLLTYQYISPSDVQKDYNIGETDEFIKSYNTFKSFVVT
jgi:hypothetical protein